MSALPEAAVDTKWCPRCQKDKPIGEFGINRARHDGRTPYCVPCTKAYNKPRRRPRPKKEKPPPEPAPETLVCTKCGREKPIGEFPTDPRCKWGRRKQCQKCRREAATVAADHLGPRPISVAEQVCSRCGELKPAKAFSPDTRAPNGLQRICLECYAEQDRERRATDPEYRERKNASTAASVAKFGHIYRENFKNSDVPSAQPEWRAAANHAYYEAHKQELGAYGRAYYLAHAEAQREGGRRRSAARYEANPQAFVDKLHLRKARMAGLPHERFSFKEIRERDDDTCQLCGLWVDPKFEHPHRLHGTRHHVQAVTLDGGWIRENIMLAHRFCNLSVGNRPITPEKVEYLRSVIHKEYQSAIVAAELA